MLSAVESFCTECTELEEVGCAERKPLPGAEEEARSSPDTICFDLHASEEKL